MLAEQFTAAAAVSGTYLQLNNLSASLWKAHGSGLIPDDAAQAVAEAIQARRRQIGSRIAKNAPVAFSARPRVIPRSPDREASIRRRRAAAASGALPSRIACQFTQAEVAVLSVIAAEFRRAGSCSWPVDRIAAVAGVSRRAAQYAIRAAERYGLIRITARPRPGMKSDTNILMIISRDWIEWLRLSGDRVQKSARHEYVYSNLPASELFTALYATTIADPPRRFHSHAQRQEKRKQGGLV